MKTSRKRLNNQSAESTETTGMKATIIGNNTFSILFILCHPFVTLMGLALFLLGISLRSLYSLSENYQNYLMTSFLQFRGGIRNPFRSFLNLKFLFDTLSALFPLTFQRCHSNRLFVISQRGLVWMRDRLVIMMIPSIHGILCA